MTSSILTLADIERQLRVGRPRRRYVIPNVLPVGPCILFGPSGSGKTGAVIRMATSIAGGLAWAGRRVERGSVMYIAGEDFEGVKERLVASAKSLDLKSENLPISVVEPHRNGLVSSDFEWTAADHAKATAETFGMPMSLAVIDTLGACFGDESQDDATPATKVMNAVERLSRKLACPILLVHHTGKHGSQMRGSKVFYDRADAVIAAKQAKAVTVLAVDKLRNGPGGSAFSFSITSEGIAIGDRIESVQVVTNLRELSSQPESKEQATEKRTLTDTDVAFSIACQISASGPTSIEAWRDQCFERWAPRSGNALRAAFSKARKRLEADGRVIVDQSGNVTVTVTGNPGNSGSVISRPEGVTVTAPISPYKGDGAAVTQATSVHKVREADRRGSGGSSPGQGCGDEVPALQRKTSAGDAA